MKRYFQKGITVVMTMALLTSLVGCGKDKETNNASTDNAETTSAPATDTATATPEATAEATAAPTEATPDSPYPVLTDENGNVYDLGGMEIVIADWWSPEEPAEPKTAQEEAQRDYRDWIQETYNFKIQQKGVDGWGEHPEGFTNFATTGGDENYVYCLYSSSLGAPMSAGLFYDLSTLDCLNFDDEKWNQATRELMTKGDQVFGMRYEDPEPRGGLYFNKRLLEEAGIDPETIYDMQANNQWDWAAYEDLCKKLTRDTDNDGAIDVYATTSFSGDYFSTVATSNKARIIDIKDGKYVNATKSDEYLEAINWGQDMLKKYEMPQPEGSEWNYAYGSFVNAEAAMMTAEAYRANQDFKDMEDDFGFVMFPKGPKADTYYTLLDDNVYVIPACYDAERAWKIAFAFNLFSNPTPGYEDEDDWKSTYYTQFRDSRAVDETLAMMKDPAHDMTNYTSLVPGIETGHIVWTAYANEQTGTEIVDSVWDEFQAFIDEANGVK